MNFLDVLYFQAELAPDKLALVAYGSVTPFGRLAHGILSVQQRLTAIGLTAGQTVGLAVAHPIDHLVLICALYRMRIASASIGATDDVILDAVKFDAVLTDKVLPTVGTKQPSARIVLIDAGWFQDEVVVDLSQRVGSRTQDQDWISRINVVDSREAVPKLIRTSARALEAQLQSYCLLAPPLWDRMISLAGLQTMNGLLHALSALWLGRSVCFSDPQNVRSLSVLFKHDYLVLPFEAAEPLLKLQETDYVALHGFQAACFDGQAGNSRTVLRAISSICPHLLVRYVHPEVGIVAHGDGSRFATVEGAVGFVVPWIDTQIVNADGVPLATDEPGRLRFRPTSNQRPDLSPRAEENDWIYPDQTAKVSQDKLLSIQSAT